MPKMGLISFGLGLAAFIYFFLVPRQVNQDYVHWAVYGASWIFWGAALVSVLLGIESLRKEKGKSIIWTIAGLILGGLALLILLSWLSCAEIGGTAASVMPPEVPVPDFP